MLYILTILTCFGLTQVEIQAPQKEATIVLCVNRFAAYFLFHFFSWINLYPV